MILSDYALLEYRHIKEIGGIKKLEKRRVWLKHIKKIRIKNGFLMIYAMKNDVMNISDKYCRKSVGNRGKLELRYLEEDIFEYFRIKLNDVIKLEF